MSLRFLVAAGLMLLPASVGFTTVSTSAVTFASDYSHDAKGLEAEYQPFLDTFKKGHAPPSDKEFSALTIPDPPSWFGEYFEPEQVQALVHEYNGKVVMQQVGQYTLMKYLWLPGTQFKVHCKPYPPSRPGFRPRRDAPQPKKAVSIEQFNVEFEGSREAKNGGRGISMLVNVVWVDGAYRFIGNGAYPFWAMPDTPGQRSRK